MPLELEETKATRKREKGPSFSLSLSSLSGSGAVEGGGEEKERKKEKKEVLSFSVTELRRGGRKEETFCVDQNEKPFLCEYLYVAPSGIHTPVPLYFFWRALLVFFVLVPACQIISFFFILISMWFCSLVNASLTNKWGTTH